MSTIPLIVPHTIADSLAVPGAAGSRPIETLCEALAGAGRFSCWTTVNTSSRGCREVITALLASAPDLRILLTSRVPLELSTEQVYPIPPLDLAGAASKLFIDRAIAVVPVYALTAANRQSITDICERLGGLPLAIELAAGRIRVLAPRDLLHELEQNLGVLSSTEPVLAERHRSIEAVLATAWQSLGREERTALAGLATFTGGFTDSAAAAVAGASARADEHLRRPGPGASCSQRPEGQPRYQLHELVRSYAIEEFSAADALGAERLRERHLDYYLAMTREMRQHWNRQRPRG